MSQAVSSCVQNPTDPPLDNERSSPESKAVVRETTDVQRVLKEVGITSTAFIGPACPPVKNLDDSLSEFYKELQAIDGQAESETDAFGQPETSSTSEPPENPPKDEDALKPLEKLPQADDVNRPPKKHHFWSHWYKNQPYSTPRPDNLTSQNHFPYYPPPSSHEPPDHRPFRGFRQPPFQNPPRFPPPRYGRPTSDEHYPPQFPPFARFPAPPHHNHHSRTYDDDDDDGRGGYDDGWSWDAPPFHFNEDESQRELCHGHFEESPPLVLILMRGLPGSGKTTMARELLMSGPSGLILSTDDYFAQNCGYRYDPGLLGEAHKWNHRRASDAMRDCRSPVIIDNTNLQAWEMKPYVQMALYRGYRVDFCEPNTSWKYDPCELEKRNKHGVPQEKIAQMLDRFSYPISVDAVLSSQEPQHVQQRCQTEAREDGAFIKY
ncbi:NEDD4-binding protein 2-like 2 [Syngnathoides biaculeatus]|uniref:NEDD4-binding protein 2-like 2 n=1 Tax=Syngnathoides biaculeatus TaxID=300417 RepID=UPI002ADDE14B|nr:NEDD4-binding protein 2-like 2 [Syngnathoides biaculeatus]